MSGFPAFDFFEQAKSYPNYKYVDWAVRSFINDYDLWHQCLEEKNYKILPKRSSRKLLIKHSWYYHWYNRFTMRYLYASHVDDWTMCVEHYIRTFVGKHYKFSSEEQYEFMTDKMTYYIEELLKILICCDECEEYLNYDYEEMAVLASLTHNPCFIALLPMIKVRDLLKIPKPNQPGGCSLVKKVKKYKGGI